VLLPGTTKKGTPFSGSAKAVEPGDFKGFAGRVPPGMLFDFQGYLFQIAPTLLQDGGASGTVTLVTKQFGKLEVPFDWVINI
jgi:hypothetical protein